MAITDKTCLIMDEVDGMSAGDRGGVGALAALIKKTKVGSELCCWISHITERALDSDYMYSERQERAETEATRRVHVLPPL